MSKSPIALVKERFTNKAGLVAAVKALATNELFHDGRLNKEKGLDHVSNKKLLHLHDVLTQVQKEHGSRAKLIQAVATAHTRSKDKEFQAGLEKKTTPELFQILVSSKKRIKQKAS
jgi:hypothetical protein